MQNKCVEDTIPDLVKNNATYKRALQLFLIGLLKVAKLVTIAIAVGVKGKGTADGKKAITKVSLTGRGSRRLCRKSCVEGSCTCLLYTSRCV